LILTLIPDLTDHLGISNRGIFFTFFTISSIASRVFAGKASDYYGRVAILRVAVFIMSVGIGLVALATTPMMFYSGAILFGLGTGMNTPTLFAWTVDLGDPANKGRSIATVFMGLEAGIFFGAVVPAYIYDNDSSNFIWTFGLGAVLLLVAFIFLLLYRPKHIGR
ncbi:MAG: MFS transporter, partial [Cyclobacteriaceae bacterium]|nr:MFS transporter [Cyclobacteriaceae bacterium]